MESKRKASAILSQEEMQDHNSKKQKLPPIDLTGIETSETTTRYGLQMMDQMRETKDKMLRPVAPNFIQLPDRKDFPEYYRVIKMPISIETIEAKLRRREFATLSELEAYFKRMVHNAKEFNQKGSDIYEDAERLRKAMGNYMTRYNPAHRNKGKDVTIPPTPFTEADVGGDTPMVYGNNDVEAEIDYDSQRQSPAPLSSSRRRGPGRPSRDSTGLDRVKQQRQSLTPAISESQYATMDYSGLSFQQAQEKLVIDLLVHKETEEDDYPLFEVFEHLPSAKLKDYYHVILHPVSLRTLQKLVRGSRGKGDSSGISEFKTWSAFEEEMSAIWKNAKHYNEDESEIWVLATKFEKVFQELFAQATAAVPEPTQTKLKLKMSAPEPPTKIMLRMGGHAGSTDTTPPLAEMNGTRRISINSSKPSGGLIGQLAEPRSGSRPPALPSPTPISNVKTEESSRNSPSISSTRPTLGTKSYSNSTTNGNSMLPPTNNPGMQSSLGSYSSGTGLHGTAPSQNSQHTGLNSLRRPPGKGIADAMITNLTVASHPGLNLGRQHFRLDIKPSPTHAQQSVTFTLPSTHYFLQIKPTIAPSVLERQYKLFVTVGVTRQHTHNSSHDPRNPLYEFRIPLGITRIEVELIAAPPKGLSKSAVEQPAEIERIIIFVHSAA